MVVANLIFATLLYMVIRAVQPHLLSLPLALLFIAVGILLFLVQIMALRGVTFIYPLVSLQVAYMNLTAALWIVIGFAKLFG
jgi:hypothetical protein